MKIGIVGGGPAGLYFALLMKQHDPNHQITVVEQNPADATYGWGVVFAEKALVYIEETTPDLYAQLMNHMEAWDDLTIVHQGQPVPIDGNGFTAIARIQLLHILQATCRRYGVKMEFERRLTDLKCFADCDLIVGADGVNSIVRHIYGAQFKPTIKYLSNKYIWYGTHQLFGTLSLIFHQNQDGAFVGHCYRFNESTSTFIVECDADTWQRAGLEAMSDEESRRYCETVFRDDLGGHPLLSNNSIWLNFKVVANETWCHDRAVLLGDALRTVHFSIGSGTRMALEDAIALYHAFAERGDDVPAALATFEERRRPIVDKLLRAARRSYIWYEAFHDKMHLDPLQLAYSYMTRSGRVDKQTLRETAPNFMARYEAHVAAKARETPQVS